MSASHPESAFLAPDTGAHRVLVTALCGRRSSAPLCTDAETEAQRGRVIV